MSENNLKKMPKWLDEFINSFTNKTVENETIEKSAEINIQNLPKVSWNDETYYVNFDEGGATVINGFGNVVTSFPNINTIEEVNDLLNSKQIVSNASIEDENILEKEIDKVLSYTNITADENDDQMAEEYINNYNENDNNENDTSDNTNEDLDQKIESILDKKLEKISKQLNDSILEKVAECVKQQYARIEDYKHIDETYTLEDESQKYFEDSKLTEEKINLENSRDNTIPENRYSKINIDEDIKDNENIELPENEIESFKQGICPCCGSQLSKNGDEDNFVNIICNNCGTEYKIDTNDEKIYLK